MLTIEAKETPERHHRGRSGVFICQPRTYFITFSGVSILILSLCFFTEEAAHQIFEHGKLPKMQNVKRLLNFLHQSSETEKIWLFN